MISDEKLLALYAAMVKNRIIAEGAHAANSFHSLEATLAAVTSDLAPSDTLIAAQDVLLPSLLDQFNLGHAHPDPASNRNNHASVPTHSDALTAACNAAKTHSSAQKSNAISIAICSAVDTSQKIWRYTLTLAARRNLPLIVVCSHSPNQIPPPMRNAKNGNPQALAFGVPIITVDGDDVIAVYRVASEAISRARQRRGPTLIESVAGLPPNHASPNSHSPHRDPVFAMEAHLIGKGKFSASALRKVADDLRDKSGPATRFQSN